MRSPRSLLLVSLAAACAAPTDGKTSNQDIVGGTPTTEYASVVQILQAVEKNRAIPICTGTLIAPNVVMTASHCVYFPWSTERRTLLVSQNGVGKVSFDSADPSVSSAKTFSVKQALTHREYALAVGKFDYISDVALLVLHRTISVPTMALRRQSLSKNDEGTQVRYVGYGDTGSGVTAGARMVADNKIALVAPYWFRGGPGADTCGGDSGGPALVRGANGTFEAAGVTSNGNAECQGGGNYERVDVIVPFIDYVVGWTKAQPNVAVALPKKG